PAPPNDEVPAAAAAPRLAPVMNGCACTGFLIARGPRGVEALTAAEKSLGTFPDAPSAATAVKRSVAPASPFVEPVHSPFAGSNRGRIMGCPGSARLTERVPTHLRKPSAHAARGTACHIALAMLLGDDPPSLESLVGKTFNGYTITHADVRTA